MAALLDVDLEQVAQVVERGADRAEPALLLDRRRLGVGLGDDQPAQRRAVMTPGQMANWIAAPAKGIDGKPVDFEYVRTDLA